MPYKVLYIDDEPKHLLKALACWNEIGRENALNESSGNPDYPLIQFVGLSFRDNNNSQVGDKEIHYIDVDINIDQWDDLVGLEKDKLRVRLFRQFIEKITKIQPDAILSDIHLGHPSILSGGTLLDEIRGYYPYMPVVMATRKKDNLDVSYGKKYYPSAEGLLELGEDLKKFYGTVYQQCLDAIDYRGIPSPKYKKNEIDTRLPDISWALIQEIVGSLFFGENKNYPIIFLHGSFGSGRRLFALWVNALLQKRHGEENFSSILNEINCNCISTSFESDQDKKVYIEKLFEPSRDKVLFLTNVDKVPDDIQEVFKEVAEEWKKNACIITTATDSKRVGLERLPAGIKQIGFKMERLKKKMEGLEKETKKQKKDMGKLEKETDQQLISLLSPDKQKKETDRQLISLLSNGLVKDFTRRLKSKDIKINHNIINCNSLKYGAISLSSKKEISKIQDKIKKCSVEPRILIVKNITALEGVRKVDKEDFRKWIEKIKPDTCVMVRISHSIRTPDKLLSEIFGEYQIPEQQDIESLEITHGSVFYFGPEFRTGAPEFESLVRESHEEEAVSVFDCNIFIPTPDMKADYLRKELITDRCDLLFLKNVDRVPNDYLGDMKKMVDKLRTKKGIQVVASVTDSSHTGIENLPSGEIKQLIFPSLQERFEGYSFIDFNNIPDFLNSMFPTVKDVIKRLPNKVEISGLCSEMNNYYISRLKNIDENESDKQNQKDYTMCLGWLKEHKADSEKNQEVIVKPRCFFQELCQSIMKRVQPIVNYPIDEITRDAEILLALQLHDWPENIFYQSRGIYDLEQILMDIGENASNGSTSKVDIRHIEISEYAEEADERVRNNNFAYISSKNLELGFEVLTRAYARVCSKSDQMPPLQAKPLIKSLGGSDKNVKDLSTGIVDDLKNIVSSVKGLIR